MKVVLLAAVAAGALALTACSPAGKGDKPKDASTAAAPAAFAAPAGEYKLDPAHASLLLRVQHMGLSYYTIRLTKIDGTVTIDPAKPTASSVTFTADPASVFTAYPGDYKKTHPTTGFDTWDDQIGKDPQFLNALQFPRVTFKSTTVEQTSPTAAKVTGDLTLLGVTKPVSFDVTVTGTTAKHKYTGRGAVGFAVKGTFNRSDFGSTFMQPATGGAVSDGVSIDFNGEFLQTPPAGAAAPT